MNLKPIIRVVEHDNLEHKYNYNTNGILAFICPKCGEINYKYVNFTASITSEPSAACPAMATYYLTCEFCHEQIETYDLDPNIAPTIKLLNELGYKTVACCEGHLYPYHDIGIGEHFTRFQKDYEVEYPYIYFWDDSIINIMKRPPEGWIYRFVNNIYNDNKPAINVEYDPYEDLGVKYLSNEAWKEKALLNLFQWVNDLLYITLDKNREEEEPKEEDGYLKPQIAVGRPVIDRGSIEAAISMYNSTNFTLAQIKDMTGVSKSTLYRYLKKQKK